MDFMRVNDVVAVYFSRLFPFDDIYRWLSYGEDNTFAYREFALNFDGERYLRHQAYKNINDLKLYVKQHRPTKIDIGAIYNVSPLNSKSSEYFYPVKKEIVFDIDISDYDEVRSCCSMANICTICWKYMVIAVKILDLALREDFGFNHILWTFSGRRGIHCWISDEKARLTSKMGRKSIANYLQLITGGEYKKKKIELHDKMHHSVKRALEFIKPVFLQLCVEEQDMLGSEEKVTKFLGIINELLRSEVKELLDKYETSYSKWKKFVEYFKNQIELGSEIWCKTPFLIEEIMIQYTYPRLDINVTVVMSHLLKSPFCIHPQTGKIGVPIDPETIDQFDPFNIPTIMQLLDEIDAFDVNAQKKGITIKELKNMKSIQKTSLNKYLIIFKNFVNALENERKENEVIGID